MKKLVFLLVLLLTSDAGASKPAQAAPAKVPTCLELTANIGQNEARRGYAFAGEKQLPDGGSMAAFISDNGNGSSVEIFALVTDTTQVKVDLPLLSNCTLRAGGMAKVYMMRTVRKVEAPQKASSDEVRTAP